MNKFFFFSLMLGCALSLFLSCSLVEDRNMESSTANSAQFNITGNEPMKISRQYLLGSNAIDFDETLQASKNLGKPILFYFTAHACFRCRKLDSLILQDSAILNALVQQSIFIPLSTDEGSIADQRFWRESLINGKLLKRTGLINSDFQIQISRTGSQPILCAVDSNGQTIDIFTYEGDRDGLYVFLQTLADSTTR